MSNTALFPYFLGRIGGAPFEYLEQLNADVTLTIVDDITGLKAKISSIKEPLCNELHNAIAQQTDSKLQNTLLNCKRIIFNEKNLTLTDIEKLLSLVPQSTQALLEEYVAIYTHLQELLIAYKQTFLKEVVRSRNNLKKAAQDVNLQKGLLLSSQLLLQNVPAYIQKDPAAMRKKELKTEESLMKYLSRTTAKTSPFSTFTNLSLGSINNKTQAGTNILSETSVEIKSHICLNNFLYGYLKGLLLKLPDVYRWFHIRPNPTIRIDAENFVFLTNSNNVESFQRIPVNPVVELFNDLIKEHKEGIRYQLLIDDIITNEYFDATQEEIEGYINQLVEYGFIEYNIGVSGIDPFWDTKLAAALTEIQDKSALIPPVIEALKAVREMAQTYSNANLDERRNLLQEAYACFRGMCMVLHEAAGLPEDERKTPEELHKIALQKKAEAEAQKKAEEGKEAEPKTEPEEKKEDTEKEEKEEDVIFKHTSNTYFHFKAEQVFYEDTTTNITPSINEGEAASLLAPLQKLLKALQRQDFQLDEQEKMAQYFQNKYTADATVELMGFYEDYYRDIKKPEAEQQQKLKDEARKAAENKDKEEKTAEPVAKEEKKPETKAEPIIEVPVTKQRQEQNKAQMEQWLAQIVEANAAKDIININTDILDTPIELADEQLRSFGCFAQVYRDENGKLKAVTNSTFPGFGKMFSRFLHILDTSLTAEIRNWNTATTIDNYLIENCDASFFNANLHPPLMPHEIWMPGGQNMLAPEQQVPVTELSVVFSKTDNLLKLIHTPTGKETYVFDLGFQGHKGRSQLFQLLTRFSLAKGLHWGYLLNNLLAKNSVKPQDPKEVKPIINPRIVVDDTLVLKRKSWYLKNELLPTLLPNENESDYFLKVNLWRKQLNIPDEVFIYITSHQEIETLKPELMAKLGRDSYKPQYINFNNPLLVNLFEKMTSRAPVGVSIEEMLPNSKQMLKSGGQRYVTEFVLQWYENTIKLTSTNAVKEEVMSEK